MGAGAANDGNYVYIFPANGANTPVEIFESDTPLIVEKRELLIDSGGPGQMKGGLGKRNRLQDTRRQIRPRFRPSTWGSRRAGMFTRRKGSLTVNPGPRRSSW